AERRSLAEEGRRYAGLGGRPRKGPDDRERGRRSVLMAVRGAVKKGGEYDKRLAAHLKPPRLRRRGNPAFDPPPGRPRETAHGRHLGHLRGPRARSRATPNVARATPDVAPCPRRRGPASQPVSRPEGRPNTPRAAFRRAPLSGCSFAPGGAGDGR